MSEHGHAADSILLALHQRYGLSASGLTRLPIGQGTINYQAVCSDRLVFVKQYLTDAGIEAERAAIGLSELAREHGVRAAPVLRSSAGDVVDATTAVTISVWRWMPGIARTEGLTRAQLSQIGTTLGRIHRVFATLPASGAPAPRAQRWLDSSAADRQAMAQELRAIVERRLEAGVADSFDLAAHRTLEERQAALAQLPALLSQLPRLSTQILHGDYSPNNLLFDEGELSAVLDFQPPDPFFLSYDLGRIAFFPDIVVGAADWLGAARALIEGYLDAHPAAPPGDIRACGRVALVQLLRSLYGVKQHYLQPGLFQDELDAFWLRRNRAVGVLLRHLAETDELLASLAQRSARLGR